jgi:hypothetical protein
MKWKRIISETSENASGLFYECPEGHRWHVTFEEIHAENSTADTCPECPPDEVN